MQHVQIKTTSTKMIFNLLVKTPFLMCDILFIVQHNDGWYGTLHPDVEAKDV